jgi:hypothetical protein
MNEAKTIEELTKEVNELRTRLNVVIIILAIGMIFSSISFLQSVPYAGLQVFIGLIILVVILVAILIYFDIQKHKENK